MKTTERNFARRLDLTSLQLFVAVCELGSIGRAAEREFIAESAVSKRLADLETAVDTQLLYRHNRHSMQVDCGLFQGYKQLRQRNWHPLPLTPNLIVVVVLSVV